MHKVVYEYFVPIDFTLNLCPRDPDGADPQVPVPVTELQPDVLGHLKGGLDFHSYPSH